MNIAVFVFAFPVLSETFVLNELVQLEENGVQGSIWYEQKGNGSSHPKVAELHFPLHTCIQQISTHLLAIVEAHLWWLFRSPRRYFRVLVEVLRYFPDVESYKIFLKAAVSARQVYESKAALVYVHESDRAFVFGLCAARLCDLPLIVIFHTYYLFVKKRYVSAKVSLADGVIFQSEYSKDVVIERIGSKYQDKMTVISSPGIDMKFFSGKHLAKQSHQSPAKTCSIVSVGRLAEAKGFGFLIEALALLVPKFPTLRCQIIGEGEQRSTLESMITLKHLQRHVRLLGALPQGKQMIEILKSADVFILPSVQDSEGVHDVHPNAVKEAMAMELPVITTELGGIREVIQDGDDGLIIPDARPETIAQKIEEAISMSPAERRRMGERARKKVSRLYGSVEVTQMLLKFFAKYVN